MSSMTKLDDVLDAVEKLSFDEQEALLAVVQRRIAERGRKNIATEIAESQQEFDNGACRSVDPDNLLREVIT